MQSEYDVQKRIAILKLLHVAQVRVDNATLELQEEVLIATEVLTHEEGILCVDSVIVDDQVVDEADHLLLEPHRESLVERAITDEACQEAEALLIIDKSALALKVVCFDPRCQAAEDSILDLDGLFLHEFAN